MSSEAPQRHWTIRWLLKLPPVRAVVELTYELGVNRIDKLATRMDKLDESMKSLAENDCALLEAAIRQQAQNEAILRRLNELEAKVSAERSSGKGDGN